MKDTKHHHYPSFRSLASGKYDAISKRLLGEMAILTRLPRECGDPGKRKLHEVVNNIVSIGIDPFGELFVYWIPAFARKTCGVESYKKN